MNNKLFMMEPHKSKNGYVGLVATGGTMGQLLITYTPGYPFKTYTDIVYKMDAEDVVLLVVDLYLDLVDDDYEREISWESFKKLVVMRKKMDKFGLLDKPNRYLGVAE